MDSSPKISVIMPVYNAEKFLDFKSVTQQTLRDIEIICINDGSTDNSLKLLNEAQSRDRRIKVYSQENRGAANARNYGLSKSCGKYVAFLDADDYYPDNTVLEKMYYAAEKHQVKICGGGVAWILMVQLLLGVSGKKINFLKTKG